LTPTSTRACPHCRAGTGHHLGGAPVAGRQRQRQFEFHDLLRVRGAEAFDEFLPDFGGRRRKGDHQR
jgi:hypothetical protein